MKLRNRDELSQAAVRKMERREKRVVEMRSKHGNTFTLHVK